MTFARILGITVATSVIVFLGLTFLLPRHHEEKVQTAAITPDQVFGAAATPPAPGETPAASPASTPNPAAPAPGASSSPAAPADSAAASAPADSGSAPAAAEPAPAPAASETAAAPAASSTQQGLTDDEARKIAEDVGRKVATRVVEEKSSASAAAAPESAAPEPAAPAPAPSSDAGSGSSTTLTESDVRRIAAEEARRVYAEGGSRGPAKARTKAKPAAVETPAAVEAAPASESAPATATASAEPAAPPASVEKPAKASKTKKIKGMPGDLPASDAISSWWPAADKQQADRLNLVYAGEAAYEKAAVLLFNNPVDGAGAGSHLQLFTADGKPASGSWESSSSNPRMLVFKGIKPGRYTVVIAPELADTSGKTLGSGLHGPIYVH